MEKFQPTIGLEIHAELKTNTKMFCDCRNDPDEKHANENTCPICLGHPGTLPTPNRQAIEHVIKVGLAIGGKIGERAKFDRKNYFYPDLPKGYQISQYDEPLVLGGKLVGVDITRIHLEEDVGRSQHAKGETLINFNRGGMPLMELVTEPCVRSANEAVNFARELQLLLRYLGVSDADMEKGNMRIEANVSLNMGTKVELKNINSFRAVYDAIEYEIERQREVIEKGEKVIQETRGWDEGKQRTFSQRIKESAHDYRYFPEPDIPPFETKVFNLEKLKAELPELPAMKRERFQKEYQLPETQAELLIQDKALADFFEEAVSEFGTMDTKDTSTIDPEAQGLILNYLTSDLRGLMNEKEIEFHEIKITPEHLAHLVSLIRSGVIGSRQAKDVLRLMAESGEDPEEIIEREGLKTVSDEGEVLKIIKEVITENETAVIDFKNGKDASLQFLIGKAMGKLKGRGNPAQLCELFIANIARD
ncbi:MAG: Asp-tRNA(Asn)/Glu-tRNA(Gln) amidotransferase subunit GatB [Anaplasmataceae bacterium]|nr:Asp-tRNA(Asn)/Glu-tRNA(Gln) amidotransferase subunit GatB [Anaplasmataceae bacterium]